ncbi:MAG: hypothetical protein LBD01_02400, partial [Puniceicoccales bacterium]|nr:hypothetical protein [Puniceicoccales bacterium]
MHAPVSAAPATPCANGCVAGLVRKRPRKHKRKADLRAIKAAHAQRFSRSQYTIRCESTGAMFVSYASELPRTYATRASTRMIERLEIHGVDLGIRLRSLPPPKQYFRYPIFMACIPKELFISSVLSVRNRHQTKTNTTP